MITHSFLGQKVDEEDIERVNTILAERMAPMISASAMMGVERYFLVKTPRTRMTGGFYWSNTAPRGHHITTIHAKMRTNLADHHLPHLTAMKNTNRTKTVKSRIYITAP